MFVASEYHPDWKWIRQQIRDQAGERCEFCGIANGSMSRRGSLVILTVAHLDHDKPNNDPINLRALCQRCHLAWDIRHHVIKAHLTRRRKRIALGQLAMEFDVADVVIPVRSAEEATSFQPWRPDDPDPFVLHLREDVGNGR